MKTPAKKKINVKKVLSPSIEKYRDATETLRLNNQINHLNIDIANLKHQIIGYKAVISYLENQLGLKASQ